MKEKREAIGGADPSAYNRNWSLRDDGVLDGVYSGVRQVNTEYGEKSIFSFTLADGEVVDVWGQTMLTSLLGKVNLGDRLEIELTGKKVKSAKGNMYNEYRVTRITTE